MIKIFQLITTINLGGAENIAINLIEECKNKYPNQFEFYLIELFPSNCDYAIETKKKLRQKKIQIITLYDGFKKFSLIISPIILSYYILKLKPRIIHSHTDLPDFVLSISIRILRLLKTNKIQIIRTIHNTELWSSHKRIGKFTEKLYKNDLVVGVSEAALNAYNSLRANSNLPVSSFQQIIYNGCRIPIKIDNQFKIDKRKINIAFCGRFEYQKGIDILMDRIILINEIFKDNFIFHIIGSGKLRNEVEQFSKNVDNVLIYDAVPNISNKLHVFDFIIMPSRYEGLVLLSIEASFSRVPVIAAFAPGLNETLPSGWPLQFNLHNTDELIDIFKNIIYSKYNLEILCNEAFAFVADRFSFSQMINSYSKLYLDQYE